MATTEQKAREFARAIEESVQAALNRLKIEPSDVNVRVEVDVASVFRSDLPKSGPEHG